MSIVCICEDEASEPFVGNGRWNFSCSDADGYRIEFESLTDTPEETTLSEFESHGGS